VAHYLDSTFSNPTVAELENILNDDTNCEKDSLMELLFFPDESMQLQLEKVLETLKLHKRDEQQVLACLCREPLHVWLRFADNRGALRLLLPEVFASRFLSRLQIGRHLDNRLLEAMRNFGDEQNRNHLKVKIRNSRFAPTPGRLEVLYAFFEKINPQNEDVIACLEFVLDFLEEFNEGDNLYRALMAKKKFYFINLQKAGRLARQLQQTNIETFLLQGKRVMLIDPVDARKKMQIIDRISQALFGKSEYFEPAEPDEKILVWPQENSPRLKGI
jgi:hypothetical protein